MEHHFLITVANYSSIVMITAVATLILVGLTNTGVTTSQFNKPVIVILSFFVTTLVMAVIKGIISGNTVESFVNTFLIVIGSGAVIGLLFILIYLLGMINMPLKEDLELPLTGLFIVSGSLSGLIYLWSYVFTENTYALWHFIPIFCLLFTLYAIGIFIHVKFFNG